MRFLSVFFLLFAVASAQADLFDGLVNYWALDGNFDDTAGSLSGNTSTFDDHGDQPFESVTFADASLGQYAVFNGDGEAYIEVPDSDDIDFAGRDLSISGWFNVNQFDQSWQAVIAHGESSDYRVARRGGSNVLSYAGGVGDIPESDTIGPNINDGNWHHFVSITNGGAATELWVNGGLVATRETANLTNNGSGRLMIGGNPDTAGDEFRTWDGGIDDIGMWERALTSEEIGQIYSAGLNGMALSDAAGFVTPPFAVGDRDAVGSVSLAGGFQNLTFSEPGGDLVEGLGQSWYAVANPGNKAGVDAIFINNERAVPYFQSSEGTWWSGSQSVPNVQAYPVEVEGIVGPDNYTVKLEGEILIDESGPITFLDGVDDFTYLAIDLDRSGTAGDDDSEVIINDNDWTNALSTAAANGGAVPVEVDFENIEAGGEWLAIEFNMAEGGGGDHGMLYWTATADEDDLDFFPDAQGVGVDEQDAEIFLIPDSHLRSYETASEIVGGEFVGSVVARDTGWEIDVNPADGTADTFTLENPDADRYTTVANVDGIEFHINPLGDVADGASFKIIDADSVVGEPVIATEGWMFDAATGSIVFGSASPCDATTGGDIDGDGTVGFSDFLALSASFGQTGLSGQSHLQGDLDCNGSVDFSDFLALSANFGQTVGAEASSVPEPSSLLISSIAFLAFGLIRRRRA